MKTTHETSERVLVVSIEGLRSRAISPRTTPNLCRLARSGAGCFSARTVVPAVTMPAHTSMLRGIELDVHRVTNNEQTVGDDAAAPSFLALAGAGGLSTATVVNDASTLLRATEPDVCFLSLTGPDLVGHEHRWDSDPYVATVTRVDALLGGLLDAVGPHVAVVVTTDHGGEGTSYGAGTLASMETFVVARSKRIPAGSCWPAASILDIAPTVAELAGFEPSPRWTGRSLVASARPAADLVLDLVDSLGGQTYGEDLDSLAHSLQTAEHARSEGADESLVVAALLHDIGHVLGEATAWGLPGHAEVGAHFLQPWFDAAVVEPIRLHVDAKRSLVTTDPNYRSALSRASQESLRQQGGPFDDADVARFATRAYAEDALRLRRWDDAGKMPGSVVGPLDSYRRLVAEALERSGGPDDGVISSMWARDSCRCDECRDPVNGQHLIGATELDDWHVRGSVRNETGLVVELVRQSGEGHSCVIPDGSESDAVGPLTTWGRAHGRSLSRRDPRLEGEVDAFVRDLAEFGIALARNVPAEPGQVLDFARRIGFVRSTNYGELFDVVSESDPINLAYTPRGLPLHTDNPYRDPVPTVQLLHCLQPSRSGGASLFSDGFRAADQLRSQSREDFEVLAETPVLFRFAAPDVDLRAMVSIIGLDASGEVSRATVNHRSMEPPSSGPGAEAFYRAYTRFVAILADPDNTIEIELDAGEVVAFDNRRVLHGRTAFAADPDRHLQGCYIDMDAIRSRARIARAAAPPHS